MRTIATSILIIVLAQGGAAAQTAGEQAQIVRDFQQRVAEYADGQPPPRIFTLPVAMVFRQLIARALAERDGVAVIRGADAVEHLAVLQPFPDSNLYDLPRVLADALPPLPEPLEYRMVGHDLVVRDHESNRVVGVLREAVGTAYTVVR